MGYVFDVDECDAGPRVLVAVPRSRYALAASVVTVLVAAGFLIAAAAGWLPAGGIPGRVPPNPLILPMVLVAMVGVGAIIRFRTPAFAVLKDGLKLPINRLGPARSFWDVWAFGFYAWHDVGFCRWSPYRPGVLSVHLDAVHPSAFGSGRPSRETMKEPPWIYFYNVPEPHRKAVETAIRACGKWAE
jgi:hypothetical protein